MSLKPMSEGVQTVVIVLKVQSQIDSPWLPFPSNNLSFRADNRKCVAMFYVFTGYQRIVASGH